MPDYANPTTVLMDGGRHVTAYFKVIYYDLATEVVGEGSVTPIAGTYEYGDIATITATPAPGWLFDRWEGTDDNASNPTTVTMLGDRVVVAHFTEEGAPPVAAGPVGIIAVIGVIIVGGLILGRRKWRSRTKGVH